VATPRQRLRTVALAAGLASSVLAASCSLFTDLGALTNGEAAGADASPDARTSADGGGGASDGSTKDGGGSDGSTVVGPTRFCATADAAVCDDFDDPTLSSAWSIEKTGASTVDIAAVAGAPSAPNALRTRALGGSASTSREAYINRMVNIPPTAGEVHAISKIRVESADLGDHFDATAMRFEGSGLQYFAIATIERKPDGTLELGIEECTFPADNCRTAASPKRVPQAGWVELGLHIAANEMAIGTVWITQGGEKTAELSITSAGLPMVSSMGIAVGVPYATIGNVSILNDDFTLSFR